MSNLNAITNYLLSTIRSISAIKYVEDWPNDPNAWIKAVKISPDRIPLAHLSINSGQSDETVTTNGDMGEATTYTLTVLFSASGSNREKMVTLRDSILDELTAFHNLDQGGYARTTDFTGWKTLAQTDDLQPFQINITVIHDWQRQ